MKSCRIEINGLEAFDVGANIGVFGLRMTQQFSDREGYTFETMPAIYECLKAKADFIQHDRFIHFCQGSQIKKRFTFTYYPNSLALAKVRPEQWDELELR